MTEIEQQKRIANYLAAFSHVLSGRPGRFTEFRDRVDIMLGGSAPHVWGLMQFIDRVQETGRPLIWVHQPVENPQFPQIGLVVEVDDGMHFVENCMLCFAGEDDRATLVPDSFDRGSYRFDNALNLRRSADAPTPDFDCADGGVVRAYKQLNSIQAEQWERGDVFDLPHLAKAA